MFCTAAILVNILPTGSKSVSIGMRASMPSAWVTFSGLMRFLRSAWKSALVTSADQITGVTATAPSSAKVWRTRSLYLLNSSLKNQATVTEQSSHH